MNNMSLGNPGPGRQRKDNPKATKGPGAKVRRVISCFVHMMSTYGYLCDNSLGALVIRYLHMILGHKNSHLIRTQKC